MVIQLTQSTAIASNVNGYTVPPFSGLPCIIKHQFDSSILAIQCTSTFSPLSRWRAIILSRAKYLAEIAAVIYCELKIPVSLTIPTRCAEFLLGHRLAMRVATWSWREFVESSRKNTNELFFALLIGPVLFLDRYPSSFKFKDNHVPAAFAPSAHIFYGERVLELDDDVPKWSGHKDKSELMPHAPKDKEHTIGKGKKHKSEDKPTNQ